MLQLCCWLRADCLLPRADKGSKAAAKDVNVVNTPNVNVVNTPSVNVANTPNVAALPPVTGSVTVTNTPTVSVGNTADVNVANSPNVKVSNDATAPVLTARIDDPGRIPYHVEGLCEQQDCAINFGTVPAGHRVVIQHLSVFTGLEISSDPSFPGGLRISPVLVKLRGRIKVFSTFLVSANSPGFPVAGVDQTVQGYFDAGDDVIVETNAVSNSASFSLSGYQLDCTAAPCAPFAP